MAENEFSDDDLQLVERALRALAYVPGCSQKDVVTGRTLAEHPERAGQRESLDPVISREASGPDGVTNGPVTSGPLSGLVDSR